MQPATDSQAIELQALPQTEKAATPPEAELPTLTQRGKTTSQSHKEPPEPPAVNQTKAQRRIAHIQYATLLWTLFLAGWNDGTTGPLLPRIQSVYRVSDTVVSLIFIFACLGFLTGAFVNVWLSDRWGFGKVIAFGSVLQVIAYTLQSPALPFPVFVMAYTINGAGLAIQDAQANGFVAALKDETKMGILHAVYGLGALCSPLVSTQFAQLTHWSFNFLCSLGIAVVNTILLVVIFRGRNQDDLLAETGVPPGEKGNSEHSTFRQILTQRNVHLMAFFILVYVGVEVTIGGWIVTFVIRERQGGPSSGYISSGFFGGLTFGRVALLWLNALIGEHRVMFLYAILAIGLELVVWLVPSLIGGAVSISLVGVLLGPMYPITMNHAGRVLPRWLLTGSIGWIAGFGQAGSAVIPFMTGALAGRFGIWSLQPLLVSMMAVMTILWALVVLPSGLRKKD
ncbi:hypothetical protein Moror_7761 [Moniliophthora roreri MCA 2997]|uniref:Major facilitator superfamily (MFS) profile domain-containing protein n=1 Tax=Moniliophthora roreri (strain MCA 2997) TaxID=1381753 RepID=V2X8W8_MONRO|nr:hypothetical protein Moror_7761 [Moniliophthora roreri MCA 2997]